MKPYMVIFRDGAPQASIDAQIADIEGKGGKVTHKYNSSIMRGFAATIPDDHAQTLRAVSEGGKHEHIEYIEPDSEVRTQ
ncbi:hypothetical protein K437DRAFT_246758 [Tilletiaria anomala UBC 951]|uniref:Inhibitor I9 domain-containing protein n=1 Tax=Tilletiaria anomala (strain ATCC 24038 / CBS 436.72 / UBC 951) TaxID=1037660 RepID=A0A066W075_TILAU|nr:uncharacterized protein K437DRAFT_246758 [Tilletiaria anomala UBC 951]KDN45933.1 hypothetical protein K437DRAFT_246758 [Tilletiaria anomala UBC 951]